MTDVLLHASVNGGEMELVNGVVSLDETPFTAVYISLFGGNLDDAGTSAAVAAQWWGNWSEPDLTRHIRSRTQALLISLPAITSNLIRVEEAAAADLAWMTESIADSVQVTASLPARNTIRLLVEIVGSSGRYFFDFTQPWSPSNA